MTDSRPSLLPYKAILFLDNTLLSQSNEIIYNMSDTANDKRIFVLYNAKASFLGKLSYGYKKLCAPADDSHCAACDLTHGGLKLQESEKWKATKAKIPATVEQRHIDELTPEVGDGH